MEFNDKIRVERMINLTQMEILESAVVLYSTLYRWENSSEVAK